MAAHCSFTARQKVRTEAFMMKKLALFALLFVVVFSTPAFAQGITYMGVETRISAEGIAHSDMSLTLEYPADSEITVPLFFGYNNLNTSANFPGFSCSEESRLYGTDVVCDVSGMTADKRSITVSFDSADLVKKGGSQSTFKQEIYIPTSTASLSLQVYLPEGTGLVKGTAIPYLPDDGETASDGRNIFIFWKRADMGGGESFTAQASYEEVGAQPQEFDPVPLVIVAVLAAGAAFWYFKRQRPDGVKYVLPMLKEDEKLVIESLLAHNGFTNQKFLVKESGYSKAKVSKVLKSLEQRGVIRLERVGRNNKVYLVKDMKKEKQNDSGNNQESQNKSD